MKVTKELVANQLLAYLQHRLSLATLIKWAEDMILEASFPESDTDMLMDVLAHIGLANVRQFGLTWEDCETLMLQLGYQLQVEARQAA
ncbi:hypothetical protein ACO2Q8_26770 [Larkinella sp. VNQ87]|uniref:hypothetical protein n=1 Tax=Larkinella sp. VNQ87 TaxID=3400921 RepID=UPI003C0362A7